MFFQNLLYPINVYYVSQQPSFLPDKIALMIIKYPVKDHTISQAFGRDTSNDPIYKDFYTAFDYRHCGVDFPLSIGVEVFASFTGVVVRCETHLGMGNVVGIRNGNIVALYAHLSKISVHLGEIVTEGALVGYSGNTGEACPTPHLHFELRDITKPTLKEMVFEPPFNKEVLNYVSTFKYKVNNKNTKKTLKNLSKLYFGSEEMWESINSINSFNFDGDSELEDSLSVVIPNFLLVPQPFYS